MNAVQLSAYFNARNSFILSCKCLIAAEKIMDLSKAQDDGTARATIAIGWAKLYLERLLHAKLLLSKGILLCFFYAYILGNIDEKELEDVGEDVGNMFSGLFQETVRST